MSTSDGTGKLKTSSGGYDLISFTNYGLFSQNLEKSTVLYRARAKFGFEVVAYTACTYRDIYPYINLNKEVYVPFLSIQYWKHMGLCGLPIGAYKTSSNSWGAKYTQVDFGSSYKKHEYSGSLPITVTMDSGMKFSGEITLQGSTFSVPSITSDIIRVSIANVRGGECGSYEDRYTDAGLSSGSATVTILDPRVSDSRTKVVNWINDKDLGWQKSTAIDPTGTAVQQAIVDMSGTGQVFSDPSSYNTMTFGLPVHLQPKVMKFSEYLDFKSGSFHYFTCCGRIEKAYVNEFRQSRTVSVHTYNQFAHYDLEVEVDLFMTCLFEGVISESFLSDPSLQISDMLWDASILGTEKVDLVLAKPEMMSLEQIIWLIIGLVIFGVFMYAFIKVGIPYLKIRMQKRKKR